MKRLARKTIESKLCLHCQRPFTNRKKWSSRGQWEEIKYCSKKCRSQKAINMGKNGINQW